MFKVSLISSKFSLTSEGIQIRQDQFQGERPNCPSGCQELMHRHGFYSRYRHPEGDERCKILRFLCLPCRRTVSVLPCQAVPYRPLQTDRVQAHFDQKAEMGSGPDPKPAQAESDSLKRAWVRFTTRSKALSEAFGQLVPAMISCPARLWLEMRRAKTSLVHILKFLAQTSKISLLGDYRCLRLPDP